MGRASRNCARWPARVWDRAALQAATLLLARMRSSPATITPAMVTALFGALGKMGMTPHGRIQLNAPAMPTAEGFDGHRELLGR
jgi:hypothetical protein